MKERSQPSRRRQRRLRRGTGRRHCRGGEGRGAIQPKKKEAGYSRCLPCREREAEGEYRASPSSHQMRVRLRIYERNRAVDFRVIFGKGLNLEQFLVKGPYIGDQGCNLLIIVFFCEGGHFSFGPVLDLRGDAGVADSEVVEVGAFIAMPVIPVTIPATLGVEPRSLSQELRGNRDSGE